MTTPVASIVIGNENVDGNILPIAEPLRFGDPHINSGKLSWVTDGDIERLVLQSEKHSYSWYGQKGVCDVFQVIGDSSELVAQYKMCYLSRFMYDSECDNPMSNIVFSRHDVIELADRNSVIIIEKADDGQRQVFTGDQLPSDEDNLYFEYHVFHRRLVIRFRRYLELDENHICDSYICGTINGEVRKSHCLNSSLPVAVKMFENATLPGGIRFDPSTVLEDRLKEIATYQKIDERRRYLLANETDPAELRRLEEGFRYLISFIECVSDGVRTYIILEYIDGSDLISFVNSHTKFLLEIFRKTALGVYALHRCDIAHRDISLENIMLRKDKNPVIIDYGMAQWIALSPTNSSTHCLVPFGALGKPYYKSTESYCAQSRPPMDAFACDMFAMGVLLYIFITHKPPFDLNDRGACNRFHFGIKNWSLFGSVLKTLEKNYPLHMEYMKGLLNTNRFQRWNIHQLIACLQSD